MWCNSMHTPVDLNTTMQPPALFQVEPPQVVTVIKIKFKQYSN